MPRYGDLEALKEELLLFSMSVTGIPNSKNLALFHSEFKKSIAQMIDEQPTVELQEVVYARKGLHIGDRYYCSNCEGLVHCVNFCEVCGAKTKVDTFNIDLKE